jgi:hypothetical protein
MLASVALMSVGAGVPAAYASGHDGGDHLAASLTGAKERPDPGDDNGRGNAKVHLKDGEICFTLSWQDIEAPAAAHIHEGDEETAGPVVVTLFDGAADGSSVEDCTDAEGGLIEDIRDNPADYYVNIHNADFPAGAIRGQLHSMDTPSGGVDAGGGGTAASPSAFGTTALPVAGLVGGLALTAAGAVVLRRSRTRTDG